MTNAPQDLATFRTGTVIPLTGLSGNDVGIAPDAAHLAGGGYHVGCQDIQHAGKWNTDYSTRQSRDRTLPSTNDASAMDIGDDWPRGGRPAWLRFNRLLVGQLRAGDPALAALRAVNFSPDGTARKRYDSANPAMGVIDSTDSVYMHTHLEWWRDTKGTAARARSLTRVGQIIAAAIANTTPGGNDMGTLDGIQAVQLANAEAMLGAIRDLSDAVTLNPGDNKPRSFASAFAATVKGMAADARAGRVAAEAMRGAVEALAAAITAGGGSIDTAAILAGVDKRIAAAEARLAADTHATVVQLQQQLAAAQAEIAKTREAAEANLSPTERSGLDGIPGN